MTVAVEKDRRTVAGMEARLDEARKLIEKMRDDAQVAHAAKSHPYNQFDHGAACGLGQALRTLEWAFSPDSDWMFRR